MAERDRFHDIQQTRFGWSVPEDGYKWEEYNLSGSFSDFTVFLSMLSQVLYIEDSGEQAKFDKVLPSSDVLVSEFVRKSRLASPGPTFMTWRSSDPEVSTYHPLEDEPGLFLRFAELEPTQEAFMSFAESYGLLSGLMSTLALKVPKTVLSKGKTEAAIKYFTKVQKDFDVGDVEAAYYPRFVEPLNLWLNEHRHMSQLVKVWRWFEDGNEEELRKIIKIYGPGSKRHEILGGSTVDMLSEMEGSPFPEWSAPWEYFGSDFSGNILDAAIGLLTMVINSKHLGGLQLIRESGPRPIPYIVPRDLLSAMWFQFSQAITGERKYKRCPICGYWEDVTQRRSDWKRHDSCASNVRASRYYARQKEAEAKATKKPAGKKPAKKAAAKKRGSAK